MIDNIVIFGLGAREDRWKRCQEILKENGITEVTRFTTEIDHEDTYRNCSKDFLRLLRLKGSKDLMFFEDDFELVEGWRDVFDKAYKDLPKDWDMLYLGANLTKTPDRITENLLRVRGAWMFHAVLLRKKFIDYILQNYDYNQIWVFDEWCRVMAPKLKFYMTYPMISYQRKGYSDFVRQYVDYDIFNNKYYK